MADTITRVSETDLAVADDWDFEASSSTPNYGEPIAIEVKPFVGHKPSQFRFFVDGRYNFYKKNLGFPEDPQITTESNADGTFTVLGQGFEIADSDSDLSFGLDFNRWIRTKDEDHPEKSIYKSEFLPLTLSFDFGTYQATRYTQKGVYSTEQAQRLAEALANEATSSMADAYYNSDYGSLYDIGNAWQALISGYDPSQDVTFQTITEEVSAPYFRMGLTPWILSRNVYDASKRVNWGEIGRFGYAGYYMRYGDMNFLGHGPTMELSALRVNHGPLRADLVLNAGATLYNRFDDFKDLMDSGVDSDQFLIEAQIGASLRISMDLPKVKTVVKAFRDNPVDMPNTPQL